MLFYYKNPIAGKLLNLNMLVTAKNNIKVVQLLYGSQMDFLYEDAIFV